MILASFSHPKADSPLTHYKRLKMPLFALVGLHWALVLALPWHGAGEEALVLLGCSPRQHQTRFEIHKNDKRDLGLSPWMTERCSCSWHFKENTKKIA